MKKSVDITPFDRERIPPRQNPLLMPLIWFLCRILTLGGGLKINKKGMKGLKPPFLVLSNHLSFTDFYVTPLALFPHRANYISELEGFEKFGEWIYRQVGCLGTRKFVKDLALVRNIKHVIDRGDILVLYPEARYTNDGTFAGIPLSVARLCKMLKTPVVTLNMRGNYLTSPIWNLKKRRGIPLEADLSLALTPEEIHNMSSEEIYEKICHRLEYNEYAWQKERGIGIGYKNRCEGLELVLYQCPCCRKQHAMAARGADLFCRECGSEWHKDESGDLHLKSKEAAWYTHIDIPAWYAWQRENVEEEVHAGKYYLEERVRIEALPNARNFIDLGEGRLVHDGRGFRMIYSDYDGKKRVLELPPSATYSVHTEYDYRKKGQCITLSTLDNTFFIFPLEKREFNATKIQFAAEALHKQRK